jgi:hypothetical protein
MPENMKKYDVLRMLEHDGKTYRPNESIDLDDVNAGYLLSKGAIAKQQVEAKPKTKEQQA